jgi:hypothetical protein
MDDNQQSSRVLRFIQSPWSILWGKQGSTCDSPPARRGHGSITSSNPHNQSSLQTVPSKQDCFWPKYGAILQKNRAVRESFLRFFSRFSVFGGFFPLQPIAFQRQAPLHPLQKKSCQKHYGRFSVRSKMCHNRRMNDEKFKVQSSKFKVLRHTTVEPARLARQAARPPPQRPFDAIGKTFHSHSSHPSFLDPLMKPPFPLPIKPNQTQSNPINLSRRSLGEGGSENRLPTRFDRATWRPEPAIFACPGTAGQDRRESRPMRPNPTKSEQIRPKTNYRRA